MASHCFPSSNSGPGLQAGTAERSSPGLPSLFSFACCAALYAPLTVKANQLMDCCEGLTTQGSVQSGKHYCERETAFFLCRRCPLVDYAEPDICLFMLVAVSPRNLARFRRFRPGRILMIASMTPSRGLEPNTSLRADAHSTYRHQPPRGSKRLHTCDLRPPPKEHCTNGQCHCRPSLPTRAVSLSFQSADASAASSATRSWCRNIRGPCHTCVGSSSATPTLGVRPRRPGVSLQSLCRHLRRGRPASWPRQNETPCKRA